MKICAVKVLKLPPVLLLNTSTGEKDYAKRNMAAGQHKSRRTE